jgi:NAD(P)H-nitrite reductase large subunit
VRLVIVGAGPAGLTAAEQVRRYDPNADIVMLAAEPGSPYAPPAMADHFLTGREETLFWKGKDVAGRLRLDLRTGTTVQTVRPSSKDVVLETGEALSYDRLVLASGSRLYAPVDGSDRQGVYNFKSLSAARELVERARAGDARKAVIVGAGFIGVEVAVLLAELGLSVTIVEMMDRVMPKMLDLETADIVRADLEGRGIVVRLETMALGFTGHRRAKRVELEGEKLRGDVFVAATGLKPNIEFLMGSGIETKWGVLVDDHLRTNVPDVYAAGDVAEAADRMTGESFVHAIFPNAVAQGDVVAHNLAGFDTTYEGAESMNSLKHLGIPVMAVGAQVGDEELRWRHGRVLRKIFLADDRIVGFRLTGDVAAAGVYRSLMLRRTSIAPFRKRLLDPTFGISDLVYATAPYRAA